VYDTSSGIVIPRKNISEESRVASVVAIITAPRSWSDGLRYVGRLPRLPRQLRPTGSGSERKTKAAINAAQSAAEMKWTARALIDQNAPQFETIGLDEDDILNLNYEVDAFLDSYLVRFHFMLQAQDLWPMTLAYAAHIGKISPEKTAKSHVLTTEEEHERFKRWHRLLCISKETLGDDPRSRYER
jgi:hypothetical protein